MSERIDLLLRASLWLAVGVLVLAAVRPLLLRLGGPALAYRSWWLLPVLLLAPYLPLPSVPTLDVLPVRSLSLVPVAVQAPHALRPWWPALLLAAWGLGVAITGLRAWRAQRRFVQQMGRLHPRSDGTWQASGDPGLPALVGLWSPRVVVGPGFDAQFTPAEQDMVLQHEHNHRRHGDHWANGAWLLLRCVFWFHPLLPWAASRFLRDQELACDARTIDPHPALRRLYANALLKAQLAHPAAPMACHWRCQPMLKERIVMLKETKRKALSRVSGQVVVVGLCAVLATAAWASQGGARGATKITSEPFQHAAEDAKRDGLDRAVQVDKMTPPSYPRSAIEQRQTGVVTLRVDVDATGRLTDVRVLSATNPGVFDAVSIEAARKWTYQAALKDGKPVAAAVRIPVTFAMDDDEVKEGPAS